MIDSQDQTLVRTEPALPLRGRVQRAGGGVLVGNAPLSAAASREVLAIMLDLPPRSLAGVSAADARGALDRLVTMADRVRRLEEEAAIDSSRSPTPCAAGCAPTTW